MTPEALRAELESAYPVAMDFALGEVDPNNPEVMKVVRDCGYRLAGVRLGRVIYTTKQLPQPTRG